MDNKTLNAEAFLKSLTDAEMDVCESEEKQLAEIFSEGWSEENGVRFHRAMLHARRVKPDVTVEGVFEVALMLGLSFIGDEDVLARFNQARADDVIVYGVARRGSKGADRTACIVSSDVALAKLRGKNPRKRAVRGI